MILVPDKFKIRNLFAGLQTGWETPRNQLASTLAKQGFRDAYPGQWT